MDPEHPGEDRRGYFGREGEQRSGPVLFGPDSDSVEALADLAVREREPRVAAREQPADVVGGADLGFAAAGRDEFADQAGQWCREDDRRGAERDGDGVAVDVDRRR
ncbi:hypothetical protein [Streptomyces qinglanensis]|uniref:hypothetical protein n=1 Tax=Streptomyces qinglanensis TaxID=943816 RepID=UPI003D72D2E0